MSITYDFIRIGNTSDQYGIGNQGVTMEVRSMRRSEQECPPLSSADMGELKRIGNVAV